LYRYAKFDHAWTISAWIKKTDSGSATEYIASKWLGDGWSTSSPHVYLRLNKVSAGVYTVGAGAAVAAGLRAVTSSQLTFSATAWRHVAATYDGTQVRVFVDGASVGDSAVLTSQFGNQNVDSPFMMGLGFVGVIGDVTILKTARSPVASSHPLDRYCPTGAGGAPAADVLAVFPFDEAPMPGASTTSSKNHVHTARLGYLCPAPQSSSVPGLTLTCPTGHEIAEITYVDYGASTGGCLTYAVNPACTRDVSAVVKLCVGQNACTMNNFAGQFGGLLTCPDGNAATLTVTARCEPVAGLTTTYSLGAQTQTSTGADFTVSLSNAPPGITGDDGWTAVKSGYIRVPGAGAYVFHVTADDAVTLKVGGSAVASSPCASNATADCSVAATYTGTYTAAGAGDVAVELTYTNKAGAASATVEYESAANGITRAAVPTSVLRLHTMWAQDDGPSRFGTFSPAQTLAGATAAVDAAAATAVAGARLNFTVGFRV
jgi:hypothetical protein